MIEKAQRVFAPIVLMALVILPAGAAWVDDLETCRKTSGDEAIAACTRAIVSGTYRDRDLALIYSIRCAEYNGKREYDRAIQDCTQAIRLNPSDDFAFNNRGIAFTVKGQYDQALRDFDEMIRLNPKHAQTFYNRGFIYVTRGQYDRGIQDYNQAIQLNPKYALAYKGRSVAKLKKGDKAGADADLAKAKELGYKD